jgi:hypothetical protein
VATLAEAFGIIGILLILVGLGLAFAGRKLWTPFMSLVGAILGGAVGFVVGQYYVGGTFGPLLLGLIGSILGSILFNYLVKIALALIAAGIPAILTYFLLRGDPVADQTAQDTPVIVAILVLLIVFALAYYLVEELIGIVTAVVGGFLLGAGVFLLTSNVNLAIATAGIVALAGALLQTLAVRAAKKGAAWRLRWRRSQPGQPVIPAYTPPPPSPTPPPQSSPTRNPESTPPPPPPYE